MGRLPRQHLWIEAGTSLFLSCFFIFFFCHINEWVLDAMPSAVSPAYFPRVVTKVLIAMSLALLAINGFSLRHAFTAKNTNAKESAAKTGGQEDAEDGRNLALAGYIAILFLYLAGMRYVGFVVSTPLVMLAVSLMLGIRRWVVGFACHIAFTLALNYASFHFMQIILPVGSLFE